MSLSVRLFQPTRPRGARRTFLLVGKSLECFNPRAHEGRDDEARDETRDSQFQPTRPRGARQHGMDETCDGGVSTHAPTRGAT